MLKQGARTSDASRRVAGLPLARLSAGLLVVLLAACSKTGQAPVDPGGLTVEPEDVEFGPVLVGQERLYDLKVHNGSASKVTLTVTLTSGPFRVDSGTDTTLDAGASGNVRVAFAPDAQQSYSATARIDAQTSAVSVPLHGSGARIQVHVPQAVSFGDVRLGESGRTSVMVQNPGLVGITVQPFLAGEDATSFSIIEPVLVLDPGEQGSFDLTFTPKKPGDSMATLALQACGDCGAATVALSGRGTDPHLVAEPLRLDMGGALVGETSSATLTLHTVGSIPDLIDSVSIEDDPSGAFTVTAKGLPKQISADSLDVTVTFAPPVAGALTGKLRVNHQGQPLEIPITSAGMSWTLRADPASLAFGLMPLGTSRTMEVVIQDPGNLVVPVQTAQVQGPFDVGLPRVPFTPLAALSIPVTFTAAEAGTFTGQLVLDAGLPGQLVLSVPLQATVVAGPPCHFSVSDDVIRFGQWPAGQSSQREIRITNTSNTSCTVGNYQVSGDVGFSLATSPPVQSVPPGGQVRVFLAYKPSQIGGHLDHGVFRFAQPDPDQPFVTVSLSGIGGVGLSATAVDLGPVAVGGVGLGMVTLHNDDRLADRISKVELSPDSSRELRVAPGADDVAPKSTGSIPVQFLPTVEGRASGQLWVWLAGAVEPLIVPVTGEGVGGTCPGDCEAPVVTCPADFSAAAHDWVHLAGAAVDPQGSSVLCHYSVVDGPPGSASPVTSGCSADLALDGAGTYEVELDASDASGNSGRCWTRITVSSSYKMVVRSWPSGGPDLDLRFFDPDAGNPAKQSTWLNSMLVCGDPNPNPSWGALGDADDPIFHNGKRGMPDVVMMRSPPIMRRYTVGVRWATGGGLSLDTHTQVFCDDRETSLDVSIPRQYGAALVTDVAYQSSGNCITTARTETLLVE